MRLSTTIRIAAWRTVDRLHTHSVEQTRQKVFFGLGYDFDA